jgi:hypothetical protein
MSMRPNFDSPLDLHHGNTRVDTRGPLDWNGTTGNCRITVTITQTVNGQQVVATGESGTYNDDDPTWDADARTDGARLEPGPADAHGVATLESGERIPWDEQVQLQLRP